ncbi:hypothetical protein Pcinc_009742, partial [Petrolisthes cinctipes]
SVVLASREHTCIHPVVKKSRSKNEECRQLLDPNKGEGCRFHHGASRIKTHDHLASFGMVEAWDLEDLVKLGKKIKACPYYISRSILATAEFVICPYNYLIDPLIRESMEIHLNDHVMVLDEAHNIEDSAREAASCTITKTEVLEARDDLERIAQEKYKVNDVNRLSRMLSALSGWVDEYSDRLTDYTEFDKSGKIFTGTEMIACMKDMGISEDTYPDLKGSFGALIEDMNNPEQENPRPTSATVMLMKNIFLMCHFLFINNFKYCNDYRIALVKSQTRRNSSSGVGAWFSSRSKTRVGWEYSINFWCLNPGVAFSCLASTVHSILLTSGTLSPMSSFQSELGVPFKIQLEANHVINKNQVWVGSVSRGPREQLLQATYRHTETWEFQDELGQLVVNVCRVVRGGVLCFLPSYALLNKLLDRWQSTGVWEELSSMKVAMTEPRRGEEFEETLALFYDTIRNSQIEHDSCITGAFLMAVCRGKVSEGMDFTDDNARAVIAVGIPFPNFKDIQVNLKRQYNDTHFRSRGLLPGSEWYEIQAYRAVNQALGRCIRHRYDWGALILVDERYQRGGLGGQAQQNKYTLGLSKWVRSKIVHHRSFAVALTSLREFASNMTLNPPTKPERQDKMEDNTMKASDNNISAMAMKEQTIDDDVICIGTSSSTTSQHLDDSLFPDGPLQLPQRLPFTSTQISTSASPIDTRHSIDEKNIMVMSARKLQLLQDDRNNVCYPPSKRNRSLFPVEESFNVSKIQDQDVSRTDALGCDERNEASQKVLTENDIKLKDNVVPNCATSFTTDSQTDVTTTTSHFRTSSPQLFDSDDEYFHDNCSSNKTQTDDPNALASASSIEQQRKLSHKKKVSKKCSSAKKVSNKENNEFEKQSRKRSLGSLSFTTIDDETDLEDFNLNQSFQTPRQPTPSQPNQRKRPSKEKCKGVQFCELDE